MVADVVTDYWSLGAEVDDLGDAVLVHRPGLPRSTFLHRLRPRGVEELDSALDAARTIAQVPQIVLDPDTPPFVEAELVVRGWRVDTSVQLVLPPRVPGPAPDGPVRPAADADRDTLRALFRADHLETDRRSGRAPRSEERTDATVEERWALGPSVHWFVADDGEGPVGFFASWAGGARGTGVVEDLFVREDRRGRGYARALIGAAVADARVGGAGPVVIGADPSDTPMTWYARLGFRPTVILRSLTPPT
ncbi:N-acetyltransferase family protein [Actinomycetospora sp. C-140]